MTILLILRDLLKDGPEFDRRRAVKAYEAAEMLDQRERNVWAEIISLALTQNDVPRRPGDPVSGDMGFSNRPSIMVATLHGN